MLKTVTFRSTLVAIACAMSVSAYAMADTPRKVDVPAGELTAALQKLAQQSGVEFVYSAEQLKGVRTEGVHGEFTTEKAVTKLLEGTKLKLTVHESGALLISDLSAPSSADSPLRMRGEGSPGEPSSSSRRTQESAQTENSKVDERKTFWDRFRLAQLDRGTTGESSSVEKQSDQKPQKDAGEKLEEIIVTAQKREERLIDTPQSVSVLSADALAKIGAVQFRDFANTVPGLTFTTAGAGFTQISLRGVTTGFDPSPTVGIYVDDVPYGSSTSFANGAQLGLDAALFDLDRVEVLRGPQGTLYGASAMGGLVKYVAKRPDTAAFSGDAQAGVSNTGNDGGVSYNAAATVNMPIVTDKVAVRASGFYSHDGGFIDNHALDQKDVNRAGVYGGRLDLLLTPLDALSIRITGFLQDISRNGEGTADYTFAGAQPYGSLDQFRMFAEPFDQRFRLISGTVTYDLGPATLTSISSYQEKHEEYTWDVSPLYAPLCAFIGSSCSAVGVPVDSGTHKFTQEMRLASEGNQPVEWLIGGFYTHEASTLDEVFELRDLAGQPVANGLFTYFVPSSYDEYAAFGDLTWRLTDKFDVTGGMRYARNRQKFEQTGTGLLGASKPTSRSTDNVSTYLVNARYHFSDHATGYLRYATGYRPGGPNYVTVDPATGIPNGPSTFEADRLNSYEAGFKAETADRRLGIELAAYDIDWSNIQIAVNRGGFGGIANAPGGANIRGAEVVLTARPTPAFTVAGNFAYQNAKMSQANLDLGAAKDERLPNVPRFTAALNSDYAFANDGLQPTVGATFRYLTERPTSFNNTVGTPGVAPQYRLPDYTTVDLRTGVSLNAVNIQLYIHNVFDEHGQLSIITPQLGARVAIQQPRTIGISATTHF